MNSFSFLKFVLVCWSKDKYKLAYLMHNSNIFSIKDENIYSPTFREVIKYNHIYCFSDSISPWATPAGVDAILVPTTTPTFRYLWMRGINPKTCTYVEHIKKKPPFSRKRTPIYKQNKQCYFPTKFCSKSSVLNSI